MFQFMVNGDGGLTTAGYVICILAGIVLFGLAIFFAGKNSESKKMSAKQLVIALCWLAPTGVSSPSLSVIAIRRVFTSSNSDVPHVVSAWTAS